MSGESIRRTKPNRNIQAAQRHHGRPNRLVAADQIHQRVEHIARVTSSMEIRNHFAA